jgi:hypothetical protein
MYDAEPKETAMRVSKLTDGLLSRCLRTLIRTSSEQQQLEKE